MNKQMNPYSYVGCRKLIMTPVMLSIEMQEKMAEEYINLITDYFKTDKKKILGRDRHEQIVYVRNIIVYFIRVRTKMSLIKIGKIFGKDHSSIIHAFQTVQDQLSSKFDNNYKEDIANIRTML